MSVETKVVMGTPIPVVSKEIVSCNILDVKAGTNGFKGGDSGHGSVSYIEIEDAASTDMTVTKTDRGFNIILGGDTELETFIEAFRFIADTLETLSYNTRG